MDKEIWMIGGELLYHDRKVPHTKIALFDEKTRKIYDIYDKLPPLVGHEREYLGYRACLVREYYVTSWILVLIVHRALLKHWPLQHITLIHMHAYTHTSTHIDA